MDSELHGKYQMASSEVSLSGSPLLSIEGVSGSNRTRDLKYSKKCSESYPFNGIVRLDLTCLTCITNIISPKALPHIMIIEAPRGSGSLDS